MSIKEFDFSPLYCVSLPGYIWQCGMKFTNIDNKYVNRELILTLKKTFRGVINIVMGDRYVKSDDNKKIVYVDANNL